MCVSRKDVTGRHGWMYPKSANSMADLGLTMKSPWFEPGRPSLFLCTNSPLTLYSIQFQCLSLLFDFVCWSKLHVVLPEYPD